MRVKDNISLKGVFHLKVIDALSGKVINEIRDENLILDSGIEILCAALAGNIYLDPADTSIDESNLLKINTLNSPVSNIVQYLQLGMNATTPQVTDTGVAPYGALNENPDSDSGASKVFKVTPFFLKKDIVTFRCIIGVNEGNGPTGKTGYTEAVLMSKIDKDIDNKPIYKLFSRKTFGTQTKDNTVLFEINWDIIFSAVSN